MPSTQRLIKLIVGLSLLLPLICQATPAEGWQLKQAGGAAPSSATQMKQPLDNNAFNHRAGMQFQDDITDDQEVDKVALTNAQQHQAHVWGLTDIEEKRVVLLMQNRSGFYYQHKAVTPVMVLGLNAKSDKERNYYAQKAVLQELQKNAKLLAFNAAYHQAATQLQQQLKLPLVRPFDIKPYSAYHQSVLQLKSGDNVLLFAHLYDAVRPTMARLLRALLRAPNIHLTIYLVGKNMTNASIQQWASQQAIPVALVNNHTITLNQGNNAYQRLTQTTKTPLTPLLFVVRDGKTQPLRLESL